MKKRKTVSAVIAATAVLVLLFPALFWQDAAGLGVSKLRSKK